MIAVRLFGVIAGSALSGMVLSAQTAPVQPGPPASGQAAQGCLHKDQETTMQRERRLEAIDAMRLIDKAHAARRPWRSATSWQDLSQSQPVKTLQSDGGRDGDLARKIKWGEVEPLPGWRMVWTNARISMFALMDVWDPCRFTLSSEDKSVIPGPRVGLVPLDTQ